jgi:ankyrin repeat protein
VKRQWLTVVEMMLEAGVHINGVTSKGVTALMMACSKHHNNLALLLLKHNADFSIEDQVI